MILTGFVWVFDSMTEICQVVWLSAIYIIWLQKYSTRSYIESDIWLLTLIFSSGVTSAGVDGVASVLMCVVFLFIRYNVWCYAGYAHW